MFAIAARRMGYRVHTFSPDDDTPAGQVSDREVQAPYDDLDAVREFARGVRVVTFEFENIPTAAIDAAAELVPVHPSGRVLHVTQHRQREKAFLRQSGFPLAPSAQVRSLDEFRAALAHIGTPAVLKTAGWGYDGKGQRKLTAADQAEDAWRALQGGEAVLEGWIDFERELSVVAARGLDGQVVDFPLVDNTHVNHILDLSVAPAQVPPAVARRAGQIARDLLEALDVVGVLCVELFLTRGGELLVNELAPRPHNSGHFTFDACLTSQFEQQLRAICGLPLGSSQLLRPAAMANLLGDLWLSGAPRWDAALADPRVKLHLYGKEQPRPGRKMGHLTALADSAEAARAAVLAARAALSEPV
jgi:5-(carboxyamino)imidazole ribonucleotide synthase